MVPEGRALLDTETLRLIAKPCDEELDEAGAWYLVDEVLLFEELELELNPDPEPEADPEPARRDPYPV